MRATARIVRHVDVTTRAEHVRARVPCNCNSAGPARVQVLGTGIGLRKSKIRIKIRWDKSDAGNHQDIVPGVGQRCSFRRRNASRRTLQITVKKDASGGELYCCSCGIANQRRKQERRKRQKAEREKDPTLGDTSPIVGIA